MLLQYWGYNAFRPLQEEIINSVIQGHDTLALLPTGGGKSICFQVPALCAEGICVVVSPLIALMKDQVENLKSRGIRAAAVYSGMSAEEVQLAFENCLYGSFKFLYLSPERLLSESVREFLAKLRVNLWAIDEAHCISQWGYDFRPPYLRIAEIRSIHPKVPVLALTATATPEVRDDIMKQLAFKKYHFFQKSFERRNLSYLVYHCEDKPTRMAEILSRVPGTGIVYVRNRRRTREFAEYLVQKKISADYYHAGLTSALRSSKQDDWKSGKTRVMVCTNAFGMGIDKPDVRTVIHMDLPDNPESYYQEAGRAGRDEKPAYAVVLYNRSDLADLKMRQQNTFPPMEEIRRVYNALANYLQIPVESGMGVSYDFEISRFLSEYNLPPLTTIACLRLLGNEGLISLTDSVFIPARVHFRGSNETLYEFQVKNPKYDLLIKAILRTSPGVFDDFVRISEPDLATKLKLTYEEVVTMLRYLNKMEILSYEPRKDTPQLTFITPREDIRYLTIDSKKYAERKKRFVEKSEAMIGYVTHHHLCRSQMLLSYFGEMAKVRCGSCDYCRELNKLSMNEIELKTLKSKILNLLSDRPATINDLFTLSGMKNRETFLDFLQFLMDQGELVIRKDGQVALP